VALFPGFTAEYVKAVRHPNLLNRVGGGLMQMGIIGFI
jgi:hypothetical protein